MPKDPNDILSIYDANRGLFEDYTKKLRSLINDLLLDKKDLLHSVNSRVKTRESLEEKIKNKSNYKSLDDVHDIAGVRIITMFSVDVDQIADIINSEFSIDLDNSVDKRTLLDPDRFGYLSMHFIVSMHPTRIGLSENKRFAGLKAEIQIRSLLQHAWAEIEHDLGYKSKVSIPRPISRQFSRLAGLLEVADEQFSAIRKSLEEYRKNLSSEINRTPQNVDINSDSLSEFITNNPVMRRIDQAIAKKNGLELKLDFLRWSGSEDVEKLKQFGIDTIFQIEENLSKYENVVLYVAQKVYFDPESESEIVSEIYPGAGVFYLYYVLSAKDGDVGKVSRYLANFSIGFADERPSFARNLVQWTKEGMSKKQ